MLCVALGYEQGHIASLPFITHRTYPCSHDIPSHVVSCLEVCEVADALIEALCGFDQGVGHPYRES